MNPPAAKVEAALIARAHSLYCELTGQRLSLGYDRERLWCELLRAGVTLAQVARLLRYLQREIRAGRRNVGALKLSNFLQPDRFEEDWPSAGSPCARRPPSRRRGRRDGPSRRIRKKAAHEPSNSCGNLRPRSIEPPP